MMGRIGHVLPVLQEMGVGGYYAARAERLRFVERMQEMVEETFAAWRILRCAIQAGNVIGSGVHDVFPRLLRLLHRRRAAGAWLTRRAIDGRERPKPGNPAETFFSAPAPE
jgi:hypothetical protein